MNSIYKTTAYERIGDWGGYEIRKAKKGFVLATYSHVQGQLNGRETLMKYSYRWPKKMDLSEPWNEIMDNGQALADEIANKDTENQAARHYGHKAPYTDIRVLAKGLEVR